jgi:hypothetical protein
MSLTDYHAKLFAHEPKNSSLDKAARVHWIRSAYELVEKVTHVGVSKIDDARECPRSDRQPVHDIQTSPI